MIASSPAPASGSAPAPPPAPSEFGERRRLLYWRLPLALLIAVGLITLWQVDRLLRRDYAKEAATQAVQTQALLEGFIKQRIALLNGLRALVVTARTPQEAEARFASLARGVAQDAPDVFSFYLLDSAGVVQARYRRSQERLAERSQSHFLYASRAQALETARRTREPAVTATAKLVNGARGMLMYVPVIQNDRLVGFIAAGFSYQELFNDALAGQLRGHFTYRIADQTGEVLAASPRYPDIPAEIVTRAVELPGGVRWTLQVAVPPLQPLTPRLVTWVVGLLLLSLVTLLVLREEARARRFAAHSHSLELLSRDLLDANLRLEERAQQIAIANRAKSRFLANVSHELRTPLNAIVGYNALALDDVYGELPDGLRTAHQRIRAAAEHLLGLVNDVLDLSKLEVGRMELEVEPVNLHALFDSVLTVIEPIAEAKNIRVDCVIDQDLPTIRTDARHVRQILLNLASNAVKFTDKGWLTLTAWRNVSEDPDQVRITVSDTGIGIEERDLERIFEEFEQVRPSGRGDSMQRGTGLGLAISRKLARILGGDIQVESRVGEGSRFTLRLPIAGPLPEGSESSPATADEQTPEEVRELIRRSSSRLRSADEVPDARTDGDAHQSVAHRPEGEQSRGATPGVSLDARSRNG